MKNLFFLSFFLFLISCGGGDDDLGPQNQNPTPVIGIGSNGGSITSADGNVKVVIPSGALKEYVDIKVEKNASASIDTDKTTPKGDVYQLTPAGTKFDKPVTIEINYSDPDEDINSEELAIGHWTSESNIEFLEILEINNDKLKFEIASFSYIQIRKVKNDYIFIPDRNFEQALIDLGHDNNKDFFILKSVAQNIKELDLSYESNCGTDDRGRGALCFRIKSFRGIQGFVKLEVLDVSWHGFSIINDIEIFNVGIRPFKIQNLVDLKILKCPGNYLKSLDLSQNVKLEELIINTNSFNSIDVTKNTRLSMLNLSFNPIENLDLSSNPLLTDLIVWYTDIKNLDLTSQSILSFLNVGDDPGIQFELPNPESLDVLYCSNNELTSLDVSKYVNLWALYCAYNELTELDLTKNKNLIVLDAGENSLKSLDVSGNSVLENIYVPENNLRTLNVKNGNNKILIPGGFRFYGNPDLTCVQVDDADYAREEFSKDLRSDQVFSEDCGY